MNQVATAQQPLPRRADRVGWGLDHAEPVLAAAIPALLRVPALAVLGLLAALASPLLLLPSCT